MLDDGRQGDYASLSWAEQETIINWNRDDEEVGIYTANHFIWEKLDKAGLKCETDETCYDMENRVTSKTYHLKLGQVLVRLYKKPRTENTLNISIVDKPPAGDISSVRPEGTAVCEHRNDLECNSTQ